MPRNVTGYLLFSHGSLLCGAGQALDEHLERLRQTYADAPVEIGYLNYSDPSFEEGVDRLLKWGATRIVVMPYFLVPGYFVGTSLPKKLQPIRAAHPEIEFVVAEALGADDLLADALIDAASKARPSTDGWHGDYAVSAAACRNRSDCPNYGTQHCPATASS